MIERGDQIVADPSMRRHRDIVPGNGIRADILREPGDRFRRRPLSQQQRYTTFGEFGLQGAQRPREPPARRAAEWAPCWGMKGITLFVEDVNADDRRAARGDEMQRRMIGKTKVVAKPDNAGAG